MKFFKLNPGDAALLAKVNVQLCRIDKVLAESSSALARIQASANYTQSLTYYTGTSNVTQIVHTGTTVNGIETVTQTFTYVDPSINGSNILTITNS